MLRVRVCLGWRDLYTYRNETVQGMESVRSLDFRIAIAVDFEISGWPGNIPTRSRANGKSLMITRVRVSRADLFGVWFLVRAEDRYAHISSSFADAETGPAAPPPRNVRLFYQGGSRSYFRSIAARPE
jgi:hypothetical protein